MAAGRESGGYPAMTHVAPLSLASAGDAPVSGGPEPAKGRIGVLLVNLGDERVRIGRGMRVAQLVVASVTRAALIEVERLDETGRADAGFGSTGA